MNANPSSPGKPDASPTTQRGDRAVQSGALSGGQPGQGINTSSSPAGQSNADAAARQGTDYGNKDRDPR